MTACKRLLLENKAWADYQLAHDPDYFRSVERQQIPKFLWIGCSDSRVPAETIVNAKAGELLVHRNVANQVISTDFNSLSVVQYAVHALHIDHIIVCGHYNCGGIKAALDRQRADLAITNKWLMHLKDIYRLHQQEMALLPAEEERVNRLVELNIREQVFHLAHTSIVQQAWGEGRPLILYGWVYGLEDGILHEITRVTADTDLAPIYQYAAA